MGISKVYRSDGRLYRTKIDLFSGFRIHIFHNYDLDRAFHDHPNDFWTIPLRGYWEEVFNPETREIGFNWVWPFKKHHRVAEYCHRVHWMGFRSPVITLVREQPAHRSWGFWVNTLEDGWKWFHNGEYFKNRSKPLNSAN